MNGYLKLAAGLAAAIAIAVVGYNLLPRNGVGGPGPTPIVSPAPTPTAAPTAVGIQDVPDAGVVLTPGQWRFRLITARDTRLSLIANIPAGWVAGEGQHVLENTALTNSGPSGLAIVFEMPTRGMFSDPCHWNVDGSGKGDQDGDVAVGPEVADLVAALRASTSFTSSTPTPVAFGPAAGQQLVLTFPADLDPSTCDRDPSDDSGTYRVMPDAVYSQGTGNIWDVSIVDVRGNRVVVILEYFPGTPPVKVAEARAIVESFEFTN